MTDAGVFERLATAVLRRANPAYDALVHSGVNAEGRPVRAPVDGFSLGGTTKPSVFTAHTTTKLSELHGKWLDPVKGDIVKAKTEAAATGVIGGTLVLTLNRDPPISIVAEAEAACDAAGLKLDLWSQSRLADFLDDDAEGQWIRRRFFGEPEVRLSFSNLRWIGETGPVDVPLFDQATALAPRQAAFDLTARLRDGQNLVLLNATSGQGKTVVATQVWRGMIEAGAGAVHVSHQDVEASVSLDEALTRSLRRRCPTLSNDCGREALVLAATNELFILIEDINRAERPVAALRKVLAWSRQASAPGLKLLCPIWPRAIASLSDQEEKAATTALVWLDLPGHDEATRIAGAQAAVQGHRPTSGALDALVRRLGRDPLLLSLHDYGGEATDGVRAYIGREAARAAQTKGYAGSELLDALDALAIGMLAARSLEPSWSLVRTWLDRDQLAYLRILLETGSLLRLGGELSDERIVFRHDRVRDQIRATGLRRLVEERSEHDALAEPAYAELWGLVLSQPSPKPDWVELAARLNPLGLFHGLAEALPETAERVKLAAAATSWLKREDAQSEKYSHLRWAAQFALTNAEGRDVAELVPLFRENTWMTREAAAWNGDMDAVLKITMSWDPYQLRGRERRLFDQVRTRHAEVAHAVVEQGLRDLEKADRWQGLLGLAGRLASPVLTPVLLETWERGPRTPGFINAMLWALALCAPDDLDPVFDAWRELGEEPLEHGRTPRGSVGYDLRLGLWAMAGETARNVFIRRMEDPDGPLSWYLANILEGWDHPDTQEAFIRLRAHQLAKSRANGGYGVATIHLGEIRGDDRPMGALLMSDAALKRVETLWSNPDEDIDVQAVALRLWGYAARPRHLTRVRHLLNPVGPLASDVVSALIRLNAPDAPSALDAAIEADPSRGYLWQWVRNRWREDYLPFLVKALERRRTLKAADSEARFSGDHALPDIMRWLDDGTREHLLIDHWDHIGDERDWIHLALWTATPATLALADRSLRSGDPSELLKYFNQDYGLYIASSPATTDLRRLQALEPWLDYLDESAFQQLEEHCNRLGWRDWRRRHVDGQLRADKRAQWRSRETRRKALDSLAVEGKHNRHVDFILKHMVEMQGDLQSILDEIEVWLTAREDIEALRTACECIVTSGTRCDLSRLKRFGNLAIERGEEVIEDAVFALKRRSLV